MCGQSCNSGGVRGQHVCLHLHFTAKAAAEPQKLKKQAVWVRMHLQGRRGRERVVLSLRATSPSPSERSPQIRKVRKFP